MSDKFTGKMYFSLWWPMLICALSCIAEDCIRPIVVGQRIGATGLVAVTLCLPILSLCLTLDYTFCIGGSIIFSRLLGEGKDDAATKNFNDVFKVGTGIVLILCLLGMFFLEELIALLGLSPESKMIYPEMQRFLFLTLLTTPFLTIGMILDSYLLCDNMQKVCSISTFASCSTILIFTILSIVYLGMGVEGSGLAYLAGNIVKIVFMLPSAMSRQSHVRFTGWHIAWREVYTCFGRGVIICLYNFSEFIIMIVMNRLLIKMQGAIGIAIFAVIQGLNSVFFYMQNGCAKAMRALASAYVGERNVQGVKHTLRLSLKYCFISSLALFMLVMLYPEAVCGLIGLDNKEALPAATHAIRLFAASMIVGGLTWGLINYYQALGDMKQSSAVSIIRHLVAKFGVLALFVYVVPQEYFWYFYPAYEISAVICYILWRKLTGQYAKSIISTTEKVYRKTIVSKTEDMAQVWDEIEAFCKEHKLTEQKIWFTRFIVEEICVATLHYGFQGKEDGYIDLTIVLDDAGSEAFYMRDTARKFDPFSLNTVTATLYGGFDIHAVGMNIVKQYAKTFFYRNYQGFNTLAVTI